MKPSLGLPAREPLSTRRGAHPMLGRLVAEAMEPRILHSADVSPLAAAVGADVLAGAWTDAPYQRLVSDPASNSQGGHEIAFVDMALPDAQQLVDDLLAQSAAGRPLEVVRIEAGSDGVAVITATLEGRSDISAVHVLSHAQDGMLQLGATRLDGTSLLLRSGEVASWGQALSADADLLLYGCDLAATGLGRDLVSSVAALTGADVAASTDLTGAAAHGGNWALEFGTGRIEAAGAIDAAGQQDWSGTMAVTFTSASSGGTTSATTSYSFSHDVNGGSDRLLLVELVIADGVDATAVSFNGNALTFLARNDSPTGHVGVEVWYLIAPPVTSGTVDVTLASASTLVAGATSYSGVDQAAPFDAPVTAAGDNWIPWTVMTADPGDLVVDIVGARQVDWSVLGLSQTENFKQNQDSGASDLFGVSTREAGTDTVVLSHGFSGVDGNWASIGVEINLVGAAAMVTAAQDTYISVGSTNNYGTSGTLVVDQSGGNLGDRRALLQFDLGAIPAGATITGATLELWATDNASPFMIDVYRLTEAWVEGSGGTSAANWNDRLPGTAWTNIDGASVDPTPAATWAALPPAGDGWHSWDVTNLVRSWHTGSSTNHGILLGSAQTGTTSVTYLSSESLVRPRLIVSYSLNAAPVITSSGGGDNATINVAENTTAVTTVTATDADGPALTYSISGGADAARFDIVEATGVLSFKTAPDFEAPTDADGNNTYLVEVAVTDGLYTDTQALTVTVGNQAITSITVSGSATVQAGTAYTLTLTADEDATAWTVNWGDGTIGRYTGNPGTVSHVYTQAGFTRNILAAATDASGTVHDSQLLVPTYSNGDSVMRFAPMTGAYLQTFGNNGSNTNPNQAVVGPDGRLYVTEEGLDTVRRYDTATGALIDTFVAAGSGGLNEPGGLAFGPDGHLYVASYSSNKVLRYDGATGAFIDAFITGVSRPYGLAFGPDGQLYVGLYDGDAVAHYDATSGALVGTFVTAGSGGLDAPEQLVFGPDGHLYVASFNGDAVLRYDGSTGTFLGAFVTAGAGGLDKPSGLAFGPDGALYVSSFGSDRILRYDGSTGAYLGAYVAAGTGGLTTPAMMTFVPQQQVRVLAPAGQAPVIISDGGGDSAAIAVAENTTAVTTVTATDPDGPGLTYTISGGADAAKFEIVASTGVLSFKSAPDFEAPTDADGNNTYHVVVRASDGTLWDEQALAISVTDVGNVLTVTTTADVVDGDTGSIELLVANPGADGLVSLREAIVAANSTAGADTIVLPAGTYTIGIAGDDDSNNSGDFDIKDSLTLTGAGAVSTVVSGGGISRVFDIRSGTVNLAGMTISDGFASSGGAGIEAQGGTIVSINQVVVRNNTATGGDGGGIHNNGVMTLTEVEVRDNVASGGSSQGGGIYHRGTSLALDRVTVAGNSAYRGGGIYANDAGISMANVTVSGNTASNRGGGLYFRKDASLLNVTVAGNSSALGGGLYLDGAGTGVTLRNVLLASNSGGQASGDGAIISLGNNLSDVALAALSQPGDRVGVAANLGVLADNGGFGRTHALLDGSAAIDAGNTAVAPPTDQRGTARVGSADIGAYEAAVTVNRTPVNIVPGALSVLEDTSTAIAGLSVNDPDQGNSIALHELSTTTLSVSDGALQVTLAAGATISAGANGSATLTLAGSQADINATLATLRYQGSANYVGGDTLVMVSRDGAGLTDSDNMTITVTGVNDAPTGTLMITGTPTEDQMLSADTSAIADADGLGAFSYQWTRNGAAIAGATGSTYTLGDADVGTSVRVVVNYTDGQGAAESLTSAAVGPIANVNDAPSGALVVNGAPTEDQVLTADTGSMADADGLGAFSYQWQRDGVDIGGATGSTYTLGDADVGTNIRVVVSYTDGRSTAESLTSATVGPVANVNDAPTGAPVVTGTPTEDQVLSADTGSMADADGLGVFSYQWQRDGLNIAGATSSTYTLGEADVGTTVRVVVSYTDGRGTAESLTSAAVGPVANVNDTPSGVLVVNGTPTEDQVLTAHTTSIADADGLGAFSHQWQRDGLNIAGATSSTYTLGDADVGTNIRVVVSYIDGRGTAESLTSAAVGPVANVNDAPSGVLVVNGTPTEDQVLTAHTTSIADADGLGAFSHQWQRSSDGGTTWSNVGADAPTYTLGDADVGAQIRVVVGYTDGGGTAESLTSTALGPVANVNDAPTGAPAITGTPTEDQVLSADISAIADADGLGAFSYQWTRNGAAIAGATASTYTLGDADVGAQIRVEVGHTDGGGTAESLTSTALGPVASVDDDPHAAALTTDTPTPQTSTGAATSSAPSAPPPAAASQPVADRRSDAAGTTTSNNPLQESSAAPVDDLTRTGVTRAQTLVGVGATVASATNRPDDVQRPPSTFEPETFDAAMPQFVSANSLWLSRLNLAGSAEATSWARAFESMRDRVTHSTEVHSTQVAYGATLSVGVSVGYVMWMLRGGLLLSSALAALPAWQLIDPLPLLARSRLRDEDRSAPDDDVEQVFDEGDEKPSPRKPSGDNGSSPRSNGSQDA
jgi:CSLREA domain-containing protein